MRIYEFHVTRPRALPGTGMLPRPAATDGPPPQSPGLNTNGRGRRALRYGQPIAPTLRRAPALAAEHVGDHLLSLLLHLLQVLLTLE